MKKNNWKILLPAVLFCFYLVVDYLNIPQLLGISIANINVEIFGSVVNAVIVVTLFIISFYYIDNRQNEKDENSKAIAKVLFCKIYKECLENLSLLDDRAIIAQYIIPKTDFDKQDSENKIVWNLRTLPFSAQDTIMSLACEGHIPDSVLGQYLDIKAEYQNLVNLKITFFDLSSPQTPEQTRMYNNITTRDKLLKSRLEKLISQMSNEKGDSI